MKTAPLPQPVLEARATRRVLLLVGSPRPDGASTSEVLGRALLARLAARGLETASWHLPHTDPAGGDLLPAVVDAAHLVVLATPLWFDALPSIVVRDLARIAAHRRAQAASTPCRLAALLNCGTPDPRQADVALDVCRLAARDARLGWAGGAVLPEGELVQGRTPDQLGAGRVVAALELMAEALAAGDGIPARAVALLARPLLPEPAYGIVGNVGWLRRAGRHGTALRLGDRPLEEPLDPG